MPDRELPAHLRSRLASALEGGARPAAMLPAQARYFAAGRAARGARLRGRLIAAGVAGAALLLVAAVTPPQPREWLANTMSYLTGTPSGGGGHLESPAAGTPPGASPSTVGVVAGSPHVKATAQPRQGPSPSPEVHATPEPTESPEPSESPEPGDGGAPPSPDPSPWPSASPSPRHGE